MARTISPRERLLLLSAVALTALYFGGRPLISRVADLGPRSGKLLAEKTAVIVAYRPTVGRVGALRAEAESLESGITEYEKGLLPGATPPLIPSPAQPRDTFIRRPPPTSSMSPPPRDTSRLRVDSVKRGGVIIRRDTVRRDTLGLQQQGRLRPPS